MDMSANDHFSVVDAVTMSGYVPDKVNTFVVDEYNDFKENPTLFYATAWTTTSINAVVSEDLFKSYVTLAESNLSYLSKKLSNFMFTDGTLRVTVVVQGSSVAQGKMVLSFDPCPFAWGQTDAVNHVPACQATRSMLVPHIEIDPSESKTYTLNLPAPTRFGLYSLYKGTSDEEMTLGSYRMKQHVINQLGSGTAVVPQITIAVYLSLVNAKMVASTANSLLTLTSALQTEKTDPSGGVLSGYFAKAADVASVVSMVPIPMISESATLFGGVASSVGKFLKWFGYSKPLVHDVCYSAISTSDNITKIDNKVKSNQLTWRSNASLGLSPASCPIYDPRDSMTSWLTSKPGLVRTFTIPVATAANVLVADIDVNPLRSRVTDDPAIGGGYELTPLAFVSYPYAYWRGDLVYDIEFVCSVFHRCTVVALYDPGSTNLTGAINRYMSVLQHWTFQVNGHSRSRIVIPWKQVAGSKELGAVSTSAITALNPNDFTNGIIGFGLLNTITTNGSTDPVHVNIYVSAQDYRLYGFDENNDYNPVVLGTAPSFAGGDGLDVLDEEERAEREEEEILEELLLRPSQTFTLTSSDIPSSDDTGFFRQYGGEEHAHSMKELASRSSPLVRIGIPQGGTAVIELGIRIPNRAESIDSLPATIVTAPITASGNRGRCLVDYLSLAYVGTRGSYNYTIFPNDGRHGPFEGISVQTQEQVTSFGTGSTLLTPGAVPPAMTSDLGWGGFSLETTLIKPSYSYTSTCYIREMFRPTYAEWYGISDGTLIRCMGNSAATSNPGASTSVWKSAGDDFLFVGFRGMPTTVYQAA